MRLPTLPVGIRRSLAATALLLCAAGLPTAARAQETAPPPAAENGSIRYFNRQWNFNEVEVATLTRWLARAGVELPVALDGTITGSLDIGVPWGALRDSRAWRFGGRITSPRFTVNDFVLQDVALRMQYRDGALHLDELRLGIPADAGDGAGNGLVTGSAQMQLVPRGALSAAIDAQNFPLAFALGRIEALVPLAGRVTGRITGNVPVDNLTDVNAWRASGPLTLRNFTVRGAPPAEASVDMVLGRGILLAQNFRFAIERNLIAGELRLALAGAYPWGVDATVTAEELPALVALVTRLLPGGQLAGVTDIIGSGAMRADTQLRGTLAPTAGAGSGRLELTNVTVTPPAAVIAQVPLRPVVIDRLAFRYDLTTTVGRFSEIDARLAGGQFTGSVTVPWMADPADATSDNAPSNAPANIEANITWTALQPAQLLAAAEPGVGATTGTLVAVIPRSTVADPATWQAELNATLSALTYSGVPLENLRTGPVRLRDARLVIDNMQFALAGVPAAVALAADLQAPWGLNASFDLPLLDLALLARIPQLADLAGRLTGIVAATGRVTGSWKPLSLRGGGHLAARSLTFDQTHRIDAVDVDYQFADAAVVLSNLTAGLYGGRLAGAAQLALARTEPSTASLTFNNIDLGAALRGVPLGPVTIAGRGAGAVELAIPAGALAEPARWSGTAALALQQLGVYGFDFRQLDAPAIRIADGAIAATPITATQDGQPVHAALDFQLAAPWRLRVDVQAANFLAQRLAALPGLEAAREQLTGLASTDSHLELTFSPEVVVDARGSLALERLTAGDIEIAAVRTDYHLAPTTVSLTDLEATLQGGRIAASAVIPLVDEAPGSADVRWSDVEAGQIITALLAPPAPLSGVTRGNATLAIPAHQFGTPHTWQIDAHVELPQLRSRGVEIASVTADLNQAAGRLQYNLTGALFRGNLSLTGARDQTPPPAATDTATTAEPAATNLGLAALGSMRLTLRGADLAAASPFVLGERDATEQLGGRLEFDLLSEAAAERWNWRGNIQAANVTIGDATLTPTVTARAAGDQNRVLLQELSGAVAGGELTGAGQWDFSARGVRNLRARLRSAEIDLLARLFAPDADIDAEGDIDLDLRARPGAVWRMDLSVHAPRPRIGGVAVSSISVPLAIDWAPASGRLRLVTTGSQFALAGGRVAGRMTATRSTGWTLDGAFRFYRVDAGALAGSSAAGTLTGNLDIRARNAGSINDIQATLLADLEGGQAGGIPVLEDIQNVVPGSGISTQFGAGRIEARLVGGAVAIDQLSLAGKQLQLWITGRVGLDGRLGLDAIAATGQGSNPLIANNLLTRFLLVPAAPAALLVQANDFLSNRVIHLDIAGTVDRPIIRVRPFQLLREEAVRFFLRQSTGGVVRGRPVGAPR